MNRLQRQNIFFKQRAESSEQRAKKFLIMEKLPKMKTESIF